MFTVYLIKVFGCLRWRRSQLIKFCWVAKCLEKLCYEITIMCASRQWVDKIDCRRFLFFLPMSHFPNSFDLLIHSPALPLSPSLSLSFSYPQIYSQKNKHTLSLVTHSLSLSHSLSRYSLTLSHSLTLSLSLSDKISLSHCKTNTHTHKRIDSYNLSLFRKK